MNIQMNRKGAYDEINKMAPPNNEEMEACPAYGQVLVCHKLHKWCYDLFVHLKHITQRVQLIYHCQQ